MTANLIGSVSIGDVFYDLDEGHCGVIVSMFDVCGEEIDSVDASELGIVGAVVVENGDGSFTTVNTRNAKWHDSRSVVN